jgi:DnaJ-class molecular chaperone
MDLIKACEILEIDLNNLNEASIKTAYHKGALKYHPDKNQPDRFQHDKTEYNNKKFTDIKDAYDYLNTYIREKNVEDSINSDFSKKLIDEFLNEFNNRKNNFLDIYDTHVLTKIYNILLEYSCIFDDVSNILLYLREKIQNKRKEKDSTANDSIVKNNTMITLNPTINNLLNADVYKLEYDNEVFYIPLWHDELEFECENNNKVIVKCIPKLNENIFLGSDNSLHIKMIINIQSVFISDVYSVKIGEKVFEFNISELKLKKYQTICLYNKGIPKINNKDFYSIHKKGNIYLHITLEQ